MRRHTYLVATVVMAAAAAGISRAADHSNLEEGLPTHVEDAYAVEYRAIELQGIASYERTADDEDRLTLTPRVEWGFLPNWQARISAPFFSGNADTDDSGNVAAEVFYNFNTESLRVPAFAVSSTTEFPTGANAEGVDERLKFIITKTIGNKHLDRLHLNLVYGHKFEEADDERADRYEVVLGYSRRLGPDTIFVADFVRRQELEEDEEHNLVEAGIRRQIDPLTVFSVGVGFGIGDESPQYGVTIGIQRTF